MTVSCRDLLTWTTDSFVNEVLPPRRLASARLVVSYGSEGVGMQQTTAARLLVVVDAATEVLRRDVTEMLADLHRRLVVRRDELEIVRSGDVGRQKYVLVTTTVNGLRF